MSDICFWRLRTRIYKKGLNDTCEVAQHPFFFSCVTAFRSKLLYPGRLNHAMHFPSEGEGIVFSSFFQSWMINNSPFCIRPHNSKQREHSAFCIAVLRGVISKACIAKLSPGVVWKRSGLSLDALSMSDHPEIHHTSLMLPSISYGSLQPLPPLNF